MEHFLIMAKEKEMKKEFFFQKNGQKCLLYVFVALIFACTSQPSYTTNSLPKEYHQVSDKIEALEREMKAIINLQYALESYNAKKAMYKEIELRNIQMKNKRRGYPVGPALPKRLSRGQKLYLLQRNYSLISDAKRDLEKKRNRMFKNS